MVNPPFSYIDPSNSHEFIRIHPMLVPTIILDLGVVVVHRYDAVVINEYLHSSVDSDQGPLSRDHVQLLSFEIFRP